MIYSLPASAACDLDVAYMPEIAVRGCAPALIAETRQFGKKIQAR
jgi:hypothetical protein